MPRTRFAHVAVLLALFLVLDFSHTRNTHAAALVSADVSLHSSTLTDPTIFGYSSDTLSDSVSVGPGPEICIPGDGTSGCLSHPATNIGGNGLGVAPPAPGSTPMLPGEYIDLTPTSIIVSIANGDPSSSQSGYAPGSFYLFSNLVFDTPGAFIGVGLSLNNINITSLTLSDITVTPNSVQLPIDALEIGTPGGLGTVTLTLEFEPSSDGGSVPEPNVLTLLAVSFVSVAFAARTRAQR
jgi:hypothetical protein